MPKGQFYALTGTLQRSELLSPYYRLYALHLPEGGARSLDMLGNADHLIGRMVHIEGRRWDFAIIDVDRIWAEGDPRPLFWRERLAHAQDGSPPLHRARFADILINGATTHGSGV